jgi:hypothetical protein
MPASLFSRSSAQFAGVSAGAVQAYSRLGTIETLMSALLGTDDRHFGTCFQHDLQCSGAARPNARHSPKHVPAKSNQGDQDGLRP